MKVLVGCPTAEYKAYCLEEYVKALKELSYKNKDILIVDNSKDNKYFERIKGLGFNVIKDKFFETARERVVNSRNILREIVLENNYDYFFSLEQDVIPPKDVIEKLLKHNKKIITGVYYTVYKVNGREEVKPLVWGETENKEEMKFLTKEVKENKLIKIKACGLGCILIHRGVLEKIKFRFEEDKETFDDMFFCKDAEKNNFEIYCDTSVKCKHLIKGMDWDKIKV